MPSFLYHGKLLNRPTYFKFDSFEGSNSTNININLFFFKIKEADSFPNISRRAEVFESDVTILKQEPFPSFIYTVKSKHFELARDLYQIQEKKEKPEKFKLTMFSSSLNYILRSLVNGDLFVGIKHFLSKDFRATNRSKKDQFTILEDGIKDLYQSCKEALEYLDNFNDNPKQLKGMHEHFDQIIPSIGEYIDLSSLKE